MESNIAHKDAYQRVSKLTHFLLSSKSLLPPKDVESIRNIFVTKFTEVLDICLTYTIDEYKLDQLTKRLQRGSTSEEIIDALSDYLQTTMEQPEVYIILNYFFLEALLLFTKLVPKTSVSLLDEVYQKFGVDKELLEHIAYSWNTFVQQHSSI